MFNAKVYKIAILSLSGMIEETYAVKEAVRQYNQQQAQSTGKVFILIEDAQTADVVISIIGNRIEKMEIVEDSLKSGKQVLLFFNSYNDPKNTIASEAQAVDMFKSKMKDRCFNADYNGVSELNNLLEEQLNKIQ